MSVGWSITALQAFSAIAASRPMSDNVISATPAGDQRAVAQHAPTGNRQ
jgi:hypothetical protein